MRNKIAKQLRKSARQEFPFEYNVRFKSTIAEQKQDYKRDIRKVVKETKKDFTQPVSANPKQIVSKRRQRQYADGRKAGFPDYVKIVIHRKRVLCVTNTEVNKHSLMYQK